MAIEVKGGWLNGHLIRRARKQGRCDNWRHCPDQTIKPLQHYVEYECDPVWISCDTMTMESRSVLRCCVW